MLKKLKEGLRDLATFRRDQAATRDKLTEISEVLGCHSDSVQALDGHLADLDAKVDREVLNMAELYGKTYRLLKRMQAEDRHDEEEPEPDIKPTKETVGDPVTERVLARRAHGIPEQRER